MQQSPPSSSCAGQGTLLLRFLMTRIDDQASLLLEISLRVAKSFSGENQWAALESSTKSRICLSSGDRRHFWECQRSLSERILRNIFQGQTWNPLLFGKKLSMSLVLGRVLMEAIGMGSKPFLAVPKFEPYSSLGVLPSNLLSTLE